MGSSERKKVMSEHEKQAEEILAANCRMLAVHARIEGFKADNDQRRISGLSPAYDGQSFFEAVTELINLAKILEETK